MSEPYKGMWLDAKVTCRRSRALCSKSWTNCCLRSREAPSLGNE